jgi:hypothetical protein
VAPSIIVAAATDSTRGPDGFGLELRGRRPIRCKEHVRAKLGCRRPQRRLVNVPPLREAQLREVVSRPAGLPF